MSNMFKTFFLDSRTGPFLHLGQEQGKTIFSTKALMGNTRNIQRGACTITNDTIDAAGPAASTLMMDPPGFTTPLGKMPFTYKLNGDKLTLTDSAGKSVTLTAFPHIPHFAAVLGKTHVSSAEDGAYSDWYLLKDGKYYPCFLRPEEKDHATGSGTKLQIRGEDAYNVLAGKAANGLNDLDRQAHQNLSKTWKDFTAGEDTLQCGDKTWKASFDHIEIAPGWGPTKLDVPVVVDGKEKVVFVSKGFAPAIIAKY